MKSAPAGGCRADVTGSRAHAQKSAVEGTPMSLPDIPPIVLCVLNNPLFAIAAAFALSARCRKYPPRDPRVVDGAPRTAPVAHDAPADRP